MKKTKKSIAKRFKVTGSGKLLFRKPGKNHFRRRQSVKQKREGRKDQVLAKGFANRLKQGLPFA